MPASAAVDATTRDILEASARVADRAINDEAVLRLTRLRLVNRDRRKHVQFWTLVDAEGTAVCAVLIKETLAKASTLDEYVRQAVGTATVGDVFTVSGYPTRRDGWGARLTVTALERTEAFEEAHPGWEFQPDFPAVRGNVVLQCPGSHAQRVLEHCRSGALAPPLACEARGIAYVPARKAGSQDRGVVVSCPRPAELAAACAEDPVLAGVGVRALVVPECTTTLDDALQRLTHACKAASRGVRVVAFPRVFVRAAVDALEAAGLHAVARVGEFDMVACLAWSNGLVLWGVSPADGGGFAAQPARASSAATCRAYHKLHELCAANAALLRPHASVGPMERAQGMAAGEGAAGGTRPLAGMHALDVGAAPGGWSSCLVELGCARVCAVDPAELDPTVCALPAVEHLRMHAEVAAEVLDGRRRGATYRAFDLLACDMNCTPQTAAATVAQLAAHVRPGGRLVLTLKLGRKTAVGAREDIGEALRALLPVWRQLDVLHLCANTRHERTVTGVRRECLLPARLVRAVLPALDACARARAAGGGWRTAAARAAFLLAATSAAGTAAACAAALAAGSLTRGASPTGAEVLGELTTQMPWDEIVAEVASYTYY